MQGSVELRRSAAGRSQLPGWQAAELDVALCAGDTVRTQDRSRAALLLSNETTLRLDQRTTLTLAPPDEGKASLLDLVTGALNVITRTSRPFKVRTPFVNANVEGTEFLVEVGGESASVAVYEGRVTADNERGSVAVTSGERAIAARNSAPRKEVVVRPRDAVQWALYFPTLFDYRLGVGMAGAPGEAALRESAERYRKGKLADAIAALENAPEGLGNPRFLIYRAGLLLLVGRLDEAKPDIQRALALDPRNSDAYSIQTVVAVVENDKDLALSLANKAVELDPASPTARIALSYALQAHFKIEPARASVQKAVDLDPQNALAWARLAELEMSAGNLDRALDAAKHAAALNPELAKTQSVLGFAYLARIDTQAAKAAFEKAIEFDNADPLPRLGLGLAKIREGDLEAGRQEIEIATSLDPGTSLIRSYLGKAYYEEKRDHLAATQFELAEERDPKDPTPWFYDAIRKQSINRPVEALEDLEKSIALNDNRAVYRSRLLLDDDLASRSAGTARIYSDLGFEQLALVEGWKSVSIDPGNFSAHRFLADAYADQPRHEIARVSELLQSQLLQPLNLTPLQPQLLDDKLFVLSGAGPGSVGFNEYNRLYASNAVVFRLDGLVGGNSTRGDQAVVAGIRDNVSFSVGQLHYETRGFQPNDAVRKDFYDAFLQATISPQTSLQIEYRNSDVTRQSVLTPFDPDNALPLSDRFRSEGLRVGANHSFSPDSRILMSANFQNSEFIETTHFGDFTDVFNPRTHDLTVELQYQLHAGPVFLISGAGYFNARDENLGVGDKSHRNVYLYANANRGSTQWELGLSADSLDEPFGLHRTRLNPKVGVIWRPFSTTTIRAAAFQSLKRPLINDQTIEPTQIAGFNQFYDDFDGTTARRVGVAWDQRFAEHIYGGLELSRRYLRVPLSAVDFDWRESAHRAYFYWMLNPFAVLSAEYFFEEFKRPADDPGPDGILELKTHRIPIGIGVFQGPLTLRWTTSYIRQSAQLSVFEGFPVFDQRNHFAVSDVAISYRLPQRAGLVSVAAKNIFDKPVQFQETDIASPLIARGRLVFATFTLSF
jgi:tetratricopeptide (TPR) repeat protein